MPKNTIILLFLLLSSPLFAQREWEEAYDHADAYYAEQEYLTAEQHALRALTLVQIDSKNGHVDMDAEADCANLLALIYVRLSDFDKAIYYANRCNEIDRASGDANNIASSYNTLAGIYMADNRMEEAIDCIEKALYYCKQVDNPPRMAVICGMASEAYHAAGDEEHSLYYAQRAYTIEDSIGRPDKAAIRLSQQALPLINMKRYEEAHDVLERALPVLKQSGNDHSYAIACNQMGRLLHAEKRYEEAAEYFTEAQAIFIEQHDAFNLSQAQTALREVRVAQEKKVRNRILGIVGGVAALLGVLTLFLYRSHKRRVAALGNQIEEQSRQMENTRKIMAEQPSIAESEDAIFINRFTEIAMDLLDQGQCSQERVADALCVSVSTLRRRVVDITGETPKARITMIQMQKATELLRQGLPFNIIAEKCGFSDASSFSHAYKRFYGHSPSQFKG